jgi:hypothetical protein
MVAILKMDGSVSASDQRWLSWILVAVLGMLFGLLKRRESPNEGTGPKDSAKIQLWAADGKTKVTL